MPRYLIERDFPAGLVVPTDANGAKACLGVVEGNARDGVTGGAVNSPGLRKPQARHRLGRRAHLGWAG